MEDNIEFMTLAQAAKYMGISRQQFYCWQYNHSIKTYKRSICNREKHKGRGLVYVKKSDINALKNAFVEIPSKQEA